MRTEGTNLLLLTISAFWSSSRWAPEDREVTHLVVVIDRFHCIKYFTLLKNMSRAIHATYRLLISDDLPRAHRFHIISHRKSF